VFPITSIVVAAHIDDLLAESAAQRLAKSGKTPGKGNRVSNAFSGVWSILNGSTDRQAGLPKLTDYPYRS
jgi:hypothetical protein